jgi:O-antigen/teichoic acid export membrane protein
VIEPAPAEAAAARDGANGTTKRGVGRDVATTLFTQATVAIGGLLLYRLIAQKKGAEGVAAYSLVKQTVVFAWPLVMLGLQTGIPRYVALGRDRAGASETYLLAAFTVTGATSLVLSVLALVSPETTASVVFGDSNRTELVFPLVATLVATLALEVTYGYFRGNSKFLVGNAVRVVAVAAFPVVLLVVAGGRPIGTLITLMAAGLFTASVLAALRPLASAVRHATRSGVLKAARVMLDYGYRRIPGEIAAVILFSVPMILAAHFVSLEQVAYLSAGFYVLAIIAIGFQPVGVVFLPLLARLCASDFEAARRYVAQLATSAIHIAIFVTPQVVLFADVAVRAWLGPEFDKGTTIIAIVVAPAGFYVFNVVLRSALDAAAVTAYNARNNVIALAVAAVAVTVSLAVEIDDPLICIAASFALGLLTLGALTLLSVMRVFRLSATQFALPIALVLGIVTAGGAWLLDRLVIGDGASLKDVLLIAALEVPLAALFVGGLIRSGVAWPAELRARLLRRS